MDGEVDGAREAGSQQQAAGGQQAAQVAGGVGAAGGNAGGGDGGAAGDGNVGGGAGGDNGNAGAIDGANAGGNAGGVSADEAYRAALAERDAKISALEGQIAAAAKSAEAAEALAKQIEEMKAANVAERVGYELKLAGCRSVRAGRVLLAEHEGDMETLKKAEPWFFGDAGGGSVPGGATGLEPAGAAGGGDGEMERWRAIAGLE